MLTDNDRSQLLQNAWLASLKYQEEREDGLQHVHRRLRSCGNSLPIDTVHVRKDGSSWRVNHSTTGPHDSCNDRCCNEEVSERSAQTLTGSNKCKQQYCARNVPCVIRGLENSHFADISSQWRYNIDHSADNIARENSQDQRHENEDKCDGCKLGRKTATINTDWFSAFVGSDTLVPVRIDNFSTNDELSYDQNGPKEENKGLDEDGRAEECETKQMKLCEWIMQCRKQPHFNESGYPKIGILFNIYQISKMIIPMSHRRPYRCTQRHIFLNVISSITS